jgi:hypothetical protein
MFRLKWRWAGLAVLGCIGIWSVQSAWAEEKKDEAAPKIQVAILLDTSNSMDGLINQARTQLWKIVNEFTTIRLGGKAPKLEVALYEYGNDGLPAQESFLRMVVPLTGDLDKVSEAMFALKTNGGQEFCGRVIDAATRQLLWSKSNKDVKCIFIAGNEPFNQGDFDYAKACKAAAAKGITVNTIFCGTEAEGVQTFWQHGAQLADGSFMSIDQNRQVAAAAAPQDRELAQLGVQLNATYLAYGDAKKRQEAAQRQTQQDANAARSAVGAAAARAAFKASGQYLNPDWDLVDAIQEGKVKLDSLTEDQLPEALHSLTPADRKAYVEKAAAQRKEIQAKIAKVSETRKVYLAEQERKLRAQVSASRGSAGARAKAASAAPTFERAVTDAVKAAAQKK